MKNKFSKFINLQGKYLTTLLLLLTMGIGQMWANQTDLITGKTLPDVPSASLNMASQATFTPDANGWVVFDPYADVANLSTVPSWWGHTAKATQGQEVTDDALTTLNPTAPFVAKNTTHFRINTGNAAAIRFTGAEAISLLVHPRSSSSGKEICATLYSYDSKADPAQVKVGDEEKTSSSNFHEFLFSGLTTSTTYVLYVYNNGTSQNGCLAEVALKKHVNTTGPFAITYDKNDEGASGTMTDASSPYVKNSTVTVMANSFTAPTGKVFVEWNTKADGSGTSYDAGDTFSATEDVILFAQWDYPATGTGSITYTLTKGAATVSAAVSGVSTLSSSSTAFSTSTLAIGSSNSKDGYCGQITGHAADYSATQYVALQFTVADGYTFNPSSVAMTVFANSTSAMKMKVKLTDGTTSVESNELTCSSSADSDISFASGAFTNKNFTGNVDVIVYQWGVASKRTYIKSPVTISGVVAVATPVVKHHVTYVLGTGASGTTPTQADVAEGAKFTLHNGTTGITAPTNKKFDGWHDGTTKYNGSAEYTMGTSDVTLTAQWVDDLPDPTATFANATYILGSSSLNMASKFSSNSTGAVTYALKEATANASITEAGVFTATAEGEYVVVANQAAVSGTYAAISKEATVTVLDNEISDTYVWKKGSGYTGCVSSPNADAPAAKYTTVTVEGMAAMTSGRASTANTTVTVTITATQEGFAIKNICTYGKLEESEGAEISWDGGTNWTSLAAYSETKKDFAAPAGFPTSFKIKFVSASTSTGGLWWRNALVTLEVKKTVSSTTEALQDVKVNGTSIAAADLATLKADKSLAIATTYAAAPTVTFVKRTTTNYEGGWSATVVDTEEEVEATDATTNWSATSSAISAQTYTVTLAKPAGPSLETAATAFTLTSVKIATAEESFTFSGANLEGKVTIALESAVSGMTITPAEVTPTAGAITDQEVTITYKSLADVAEADVNLIVRYNDDVKLTIPVTYSSTAGVEALTPISAATTWNWNAANSYDGDLSSIDANSIVVLANNDGWDAAFNAASIAGKLQYVYRKSAKCAQGHTLKFNTTIPGKVYVTYSNTGGNAARTVNVNGTKGSNSSAKADNANTFTESFLVDAGDVLINGVLVSDNSSQMLRFYKVEFKPVYSVTYSEGEGSIKSGETIPTQADEAAGEKITLAAATVLEKDGYDFTGWLCNVDGLTYEAGAEYTMTAAATTFTAQWTVHIDPVDPTLTYSNGAYTIGLAALDLSTLQTAAESTGAITYTVKTVGGTGATIDGNNFTATAAGTAVITASQEAVLGYNAKEVDFEVVVTEAVEIDGIKLVEAGELTGNFITASTLTEGANVVEGINYAKYIKFSSTFSGSYQGGAKNNYLMYDLKKQNTTFYLYVHNNTSTAYKILVYTYNTASEKAKEIEVAANENALKSFELNDVTENTRVFIGVENTNIYLCQVVAVESGTDLMKGGEIGYSIDFGAKSRFSAAGGATITMDGMEFVTSSQYVPNNGTEVALSTLGTHYVKFTLPVAAEVEVTTNSANKYFIGSTSASTTYEYKPATAGEMHSFTLAAGTWYLNPNGSNIKLTNLAFTAPICNLAISTQPASNTNFGAGNLTATVVAASTTEGAALAYQWYNASDDSEVSGANEATLTTTTPGEYYVVVTASKAGYQNKVVQSNTIELGYRDLTIATLSALSQGGNEITLQDGVYEYNVYLPEGTTDVPVLAATATQAGYGATAVPTDAAAFDNYEAISTVLVTAENGTTQQTYTVHFYVDHEILALVDVTGNMTWDFSKAQSGTTAGSNMCNEAIFANVAGINNNDDFESDNLMVTANKFSSGKLQASMIKFHTTVGGVVEVTFSHTGNNKTDGRALVVNSTYQSALSHNQTAMTYTCYVPAGDVVLTVTTGDGGNMLNFTSVDFKAKATPDYSRTVSNNIGTLCVDHNVLAGGFVGATFYQIAGRNQEYSYKIDFEEVGADEELVAGEPYIFQSTTGKIELYYGKTVATQPVDVKGMHGTFSTFNLPITEENKLDVMYISNNKLWNCGDLVGTGLNVVENRAYIVMSEVPEQTITSAPGRRRITLVTNAEQVATGVDTLNASETPVKVMIDGQIFIIRGEKMFDVTGKLVK